MLKLHNKRAAGFAPSFISVESPVSIAYEIKSSVVMKTQYNELRVILRAFKMWLFVQGHWVF